jgi:hypothetical protein
MTDADECETACCVENLDGSRATNVVKLTAQRGRLPSAAAPAAAAKSECSGSAVIYPQGITGQTDGRGLWRGFARSKFRTFGAYVP